MRPMIITALRRALTAVWAAMVISLICLAAWSNLASAVVITGGSMTPALPAGAVVAPTTVEASEIGAGDILTVAGDNGVILTHRVARVLDLAEGRFFELQGDANVTADAALVPARAVMGRVDSYLPYAGFVIALLSIPSGLVSILAALGALLVGIWLLEEAEVGARSGVRTNATSKVAHGTPA
jgi:signal peptidase